MTVTVGGDKNYDTKGFVHQPRAMGVTPHVAQYPETNCVAGALLHRLTSRRHFLQWRDRRHGGTRHGFLRVRYTHLPTRPAPTDVLCPEARHEPPHLALLISRTSPAGPFLRWSLGRLRLLG